MGGGGGGGGGGGVGASVRQETMEERVRRLRAAHLAAKQHSVSRMDRVIDGSRRLFDAAHKFTVMGLIGFSGTSASLYLSGCLAGWLAGWLEQYSAYTILQH